MEIFITILIFVLAMALILSIYYWAYKKIVQRFQKKDQNMLELKEEVKKLNEEVRLLNEKIDSK